MLLNSSFDFSRLPLPSRASPIETIYAAMPAYLYLNSTILGGLLRPLLDLQPQGNDHAALDLGKFFFP